VLDGDNVRRGLTAISDLPQPTASRTSGGSRRFASLVADAGLVVLVAFILPFRCERAMARGLMRPGEFVKVFVDAPLAVCEARDPKGVYRKARRGQIANFTGLDSPCEPPGKSRNQAGSVLTMEQTVAGPLDYLEHGGKLKHAE